ncbi:RNA-directed DNA polymerase from mobile element jockey, partial [Trichonephila clavipes]
YITQPQIQANIFADFASKNAYHEPIPLDFFHKEDNNLNKPFNIFEIHRAIKLSKNSTPGADHITASLKNLDRNGCEIIRYFQDLFDNAIVPNSWKHAVILPIPKQCKDKTRISSYRPIALTSIFSKAAVAEWYGYRTVACFVTGSSPVPLKTRRVGQRCTLNLSRAETSSRWCGVVVRRGGASSGVVHVT